ncbi:hypothetical protein [Halomontanus rarus]|uniref:hypothetical protein n=1 Tax=Halomontanus rarus TaxID=3034020 RepID=UPI0023E8A4CC|nr:hypothetical protein [Halovivax sp. TS33]
MTRQQSSLTPSRRTLLRYGFAVSSGALASSTTDANASANTTSSDGSDGGTDSGAQVATHGKVFPYQWTPDARFKIVESDVGWRPSEIGETDAGASSHVIRYDFSSSYRASLFTDDSSVREGRRYRFNGTSARAVAGQNLIGVDVIPLE